jgi:hypothetical protein
MRKYLGTLGISSASKFEKFSGLKEDRDYAFVEYQGSNITHWDFAEDGLSAEKIKASRLCSSALVIADGDIASKGTRDSELESALDGRYIRLEHKEIENLIPIELVRKYLSDRNHDAEKIDTLEQST